MRVVAFILALASSVSLALVQAYSVEPVKQEWSGWTGFQDTVGQVLTCCWDTLTFPSGYVELFVGDSGTGGTYDLEVKDGNDLVAYHYDVAQNRNHDWLRFDSLTLWSGQTFTKGKRYEFRFTRSGSESDLVGLDCGPADATMA